MLACVGYARSVRKRRRLQGIHEINRVVGVSRFGLEIQRVSKAISKAKHAGVTALNFQPNLERKHSKQEDKNKFRILMIHIDENIWKG